MPRIEKLGTVSTCRKKNNNNNSILGDASVRWTLDQETDQSTVKGVASRLVFELQLVIFVWPLWLNYVLGKMKSLQ